MLRLLSLAFVLLALARPALPARTEELTRAEVISLARGFAGYEWTGAAANGRHGKDAAGIQVATPSAERAEGAPPGYWIIGQTNAGIPYKWGGFDSLASFSAGLRAGKAAGDLYHPGKRLQADAAVSDEAVGLDCSGFISRCWRLPKKYGTGMLPSLCRPLPAAADLRAGDIINYAGGHVLLFHCWLDEQHDRAELFEAEPYSKVRASEHSVRELLSGGFKLWRYRKIKD